VKVGSAYKFPKFTRRCPFLIVYTQHSSSYSAGSGRRVCISLNVT